MCSARIGSFGVKMVSAMLLAVAAHGASASPLSSLTGFFSNDDDIVWADFNVAQNTLLSARATSFGDGGFAQVLSLFALNVDQDLLQFVSGSANTCGTPGAGAESGGLCWDAFFTTMLSAGNYRLVVSQDANTPNGPGFADGFAQTGLSNYTGLNYFGDPSRSFVNFDGGQRTGAYDVDIQISEPLPEPNTISLLLIGLACAAAGARYVTQSRLS